MKNCGLRWCLKMRIEKGRCLLVGEGKVKLVCGKAEAVGALVSPGQIIEIPKGKKIPFEILEDSEFDVSAEYEILEQSTIPEEWKKLVDRVLSQQASRILILGPVDVGKSFFTTFMANKLFRYGKVAVMDCDTGQSDIGPPGTIGLGFVKRHVLFLYEIEADYIYFVGSHSPGSHLVPFLTGIARLAKRAEEADFLLVDTTGWVFGDGARLLKRAKYEILEPDLVVALQRSDEIEHLLAVIPDEKVVRLKVSRKASPTSAEVRQRLREMVAKKWVKGFALVKVPLEKIKFDRAYFGTGKKVDVEGSAWAEEFPDGFLVIAEKFVSVPNKKVKFFKKGGEKNVLVGILDENEETVGIGIIDHIDFEESRLYLYTDVPPSKIKVVQIGSLKLKPSGEEAGFLEPGAF